MASPSKNPAPSKRKFNGGAPLSPPPMKRKVQSTTTCKCQRTPETKPSQADINIATAVASFFTPVSQKPPEKVIWHERAANPDTPKTLLVGRYFPPIGDSQISNSSPDITRKRRKVAAFDFVSDARVFNRAGF